MKLPGMNSETKLEEYVENSTPLISNFNDRIRPLLDAVDKLRHLKVMDEGIQLPTIVVVGDQSSGKSSVLESLAGISLPRGQGICTRVPLIMRLQNHSSPEAKLHLEFHGKEVPTDEASISEAISSATDEIAGDGKCISNTPLTLVVNKKGVPDLTMVDLPVYALLRCGAATVIKFIGSNLATLTIDFFSRQALPIPSPLRSPFPSERLCSGLKN